MALIDTVNDCDREKQKIKDECGDPIDENKEKCPDPSAVEAAKKEHRAACNILKGSPGRKSAKSAATKKVYAAHEDYAMAISQNSCIQALKCALIPYNKGNKGACCHHQTPDHLVPAAQFGADRGKNHPNYETSNTFCHEDQLASKT